MRVLQDSFNAMWTRIYLYEETFSTGTMFTLYRIIGWLVPRKAHSTHFTATIPSFSRFASAKATGYIP